jgi:flagellar basal-body rod modification protein FlgD
MAVSSVGSAQSAASTASSASAAASSAVGLSQNDFMTLLIAQMQNQDPLNPVDATDFVTQLAQFTQVSTMSGMSTTLGQMSSMQQISQGSSLIGKQITYTVPGQATPGSGVVSSLQINSGNVNLVVGNQLVPLSQVVSIQPGTHS